MRFSIKLSVVIIAAALVQPTQAESYFGAQFLNGIQAQKKWGILNFNAEKFAAQDEIKRGSMAADLLIKKTYIGREMSQVRKDMGTPNSYFFSDTIYAYKITEPGLNKESWHLIFIPDDKLEKVKEVKIHKKCCYPFPL